MVSKIQYMVQIRTNQEFDQMDRIVGLWFVVALGE